MLSACSDEKEIVSAVIAVESEKEQFAEVVEANSAAQRNCTAVKASECIVGSNSQQVLGKLGGIAAERTRLTHLLRLAELHPNGAHRSPGHCPATQYLHEIGSVMKGLDCSSPRH